MNLPAWSANLSDTSHDVPELVALLGEAAFPRRFEGALRACLSHLGFARGFVYQRRFPANEPGAVLRIGDAGSPAELQEPELERLLADGGVRACTPDAPELAPLAALQGAEVVLIPVAIDGRLDVLLAGVTAPGFGAITVERAVAIRPTLEAAFTRDRRWRLERLLLDAIAQGADPIELTDRRAFVLYVNRAWEGLTGYSAEEAVGRPLAELLRDPIDPVHDASFYQYAMDVLKQGRPWIATMASRGKDGRRLMQELTVTPVTGDDHAQACLATRRSVHGRMEREVALARAHHEFRAVLSGMPAGVAVLRDGQIYFANQAMLEVLGRSLDQAIGRRLEDFVHPEWRSSLESDGAPAAGHPQTVRFQRFDGSVRFCEVTPAGSVSFEGKPAAIVVLRDLSEQKIAQEQLALADRLTAMGAMAAGVAHEINNPLTYVIGDLEFLRESIGETLKDLAHVEALDEALEGATRIRRIVADLKSFSHTGDDHQLEAVDTVTVLNSACNMVLNEIRHRARLVRDFCPDLFVLAQEGRLMQVVVNLLLNAAHAIPEADGRDHEIAVRTRRHAEGHVALTVEDTGMGMPRQILDRVFEPFFTTKPSGVGSGLGLPISQRLVGEFGGVIHVESTYGAGTRVTVELLEAAAEPRSALHRAVDPGLRARRSRILVIDDEPSVATVLKRLLGDHEIEVANSGSEALARLAVDAKRDVVVCDVMMPGMTGADLFEVVQTRWPELASRFVFITGGTFTERTSAFLDGQVRSLSKPFDPDRVRSLLLEMLGPAD